MCKKISDARQSLIDGSVACGCRRHWFFGLCSQSSGHDGFLAEPTAELKADSVSTVGLGGLGFRV